MGSFFSLPITKTQEKKHCDRSNDETWKRLKMTSSYCDEHSELIPCLPNEISLQILAGVPRIHYSSMKLVSRSWKAALTSHEVFRVRKELKSTEEWLYILINDKDGMHLWHAFDPQSRKWQRLPPMPNIVSEKEAKRGLLGSWIWNSVGTHLDIPHCLSAWIKRSKVIERIPFCGCASGAVDGCLYVLGGFTRLSAMKSVWRYDPCVNQWQEITSMTTARAFCKTSTLNNKLYVVGGVSRQKDGSTPLQSAEVYDPCTGLWTLLPSIPFSKAQSFSSAFLAEMLKPIATGMTSYRGRLCASQSLFSWPFFVDVGGKIYDPEKDSWVEMPAGMGEGWPAKQVGGKLSVVVDGELYALDPSGSLGFGEIKLYDHHKDAWKTVIGRVPLHHFDESESPYLLTGFHGMICMITRDIGNSTTILQADLQERICSSSATVSSPSTNFTCESQESLVEAEANVWSVITTKNLGAAEFVGCQVLAI